MEISNFEADILVIQLEAVIFCFAKHAISPKKLSGTRKMTISSVNVRNGLGGYIWIRSSDSILVRFTSKAGILHLHCESAQEHPAVVDAPESSPFQCRVVPEFVEFVAVAVCHGVQTLAGECAIARVQFVGVCKWTSSAGAL